MKWCKSVFYIAGQNIRKWQVNPRIWIIGIILAILIHSYWTEMAKVGDYLGEKPSLWIFPFLYEQFYMKLIFTLPLVLLFCDTPFWDANQLFVLIRAGRKKWIAGQLLYITFAVFVYYAFLLLATLLIGLFYGSADSSWGGVFYTIANSGVLYAADAHFIEIPYEVLHCFTPLSAIGYTFLLSWLIGVFIGVFMFALSLGTRHRAVSLILPSALVIFSCFVENVKDTWIWFSPVSWNTINNIAMDGQSQNPTYAYCLTVILALILICVAVSFWIGGRKKAKIVLGG